MSWAFPEWLLSIRAIWEVVVLASWNVRQHTCMYALMTFFDDLRKFTSKEGSGANVDELYHLICHVTKSLFGYRFEVGIIRQWMLLYYSYTYEHAFV